MSQSPTDANSQATDAYAMGWMATQRMVREGKSWSGYERNCVFVNTKGPRFADVSGISGLDFDDDARSAALVDWDGDGRLDVWLSNRTSPRVRLMHNVAPQVGSFVEFQLSGRSCNRDAIGARVEVYMKGAASPPLLRTLHAGEGYTAQSSKWLHVGLDSGATVDHVEVAWPGGKRESFAGVQGGGRYRLVQGSGKAEPAPAPQRTLALTPSKGPARIPVAEKARIITPTLPPLPPLTFSDLNGKDQKLQDGSKKPLLINLWASWCPNCVAEMKGWAQHADDLRKLGVRIVALSVDDDATKQQKAKEFVKEIAWPFDVGFAPTPVVDVLDAIQQVVLERDRPLPLPASFLVDGDGRITAIYKGPIEAATLCADVALCGSGAAKLRDAACPFPGTWLADPPPLKINDYVDAFTQRGYPKLASVMAATAGARGEEKDVPARVTVAVTLLRQGKAKDAEAELRAYLRDVPNDGNALNNLGGALATQGRDAEAIAVYEQSLRIRPNHPDTLTNYARSLRIMGRVPDAEATLRQVLSSYPEHISALNNLASILLNQGRTDEGAELLQRALRQDPDHVQAGLNFAMLLGNQGHADESIMWLKRVLRNDPKNVTALGFLGLMHQRSQRYEEAEKCYTEALSLSPTDGATLRRLGQLYVETGNLKAAEDVAQRLERIDPKLAQALDAAILKAKSAGGKK